jgi:hypothetical protein
MRGVGFAIEEIRGANLTMRALGKVVPDPSLRLYHVVDAVDRALRIVPRIDALAEIGMIRARKP